MWRRWPKQNNAVYPTVKHSFFPLERVSFHFFPTSLSPFFLLFFNLVRVFEAAPLELNDIRSVLDWKQKRESWLKRGQQLMRLDLECNGPVKASV